MSEIWHEDYHRCEYCGKSYHTDEMFLSDRFCSECIRHATTEYACEDCEAEFQFTGIPFWCPICSSTNITHEEAYLARHMKELRSGKFH